MEVYIFNRTGLFMKVSGAVLLIVLYALGTIEPGFLHSLFHSTHSEVLHIAENEKDPCHRKIYHHSSEGGCSHSSHLIANEKCSFPSYILRVDPFSVDLPAYAAWLSPLTYYLIKCIDVLVSFGGSELSSRAPPYL
jgi:hypothetical protein